MCVTFSNKSLVRNAKIDLLFNFNEESCKSYPTRSLSHHQFYFTLLYLFLSIGLWVDPGRLRYYLYLKILLKDILYKIIYYCDVHLKWDKEPIFPQNFRLISLFSGIPKIAETTKKSSLKPYQVQTIWMSSEALY